MKKIILSLVIILLTLSACKTNQITKQFGEVFANNTISMEVSSSNQKDKISAKLNLKEKVICQEVFMEEQNFKICIDEENLYFAQDNQWKYAQANEYKRSLEQIQLLDMFYYPGDEFKNYRITKHDIDSISLTLDVEFESEKLEGKKLKSVLKKKDGNYRLKHAQEEVIIAIEDEVITISSKTVTIKLSGSKKKLTIPKEAQNLIN